MARNNEKNVDLLLPDIMQWIFFLILNTHVFFKDAKLLVVLSENICFISKAFCTLIFASENMR